MLHTQQATDRFYDPAGSQHVPNIRFEDGGHRVGLRIADCRFGIAGWGLRIGDCVVLSGIYSADADVAENTPLVPRMARVLRIDDSQSDIRCVGLRFVTEINSGLKNSEPLRAGATGVAPMIVPLRLLGGTRPSLPVIDIYPANLRQAAS